MFSWTFCYISILFSIFHTQAFGNLTKNCTDCVEQLCKPQQFRCVNGDCIDEFSICDGVVDCKDGSDETTLICPYLACPSITFRCKYGACINAAFVCDGFKNCADGSDEDGSLCSHYILTTPLPPTEEKTSAPEETITTNTISEEEALTKTPESITPGCVIPPPPEHGIYQGIPPLGNFSYGELVQDGAVLVYRCNENFALDSMLSKDFILCFNQEWVKPPPVCLSTCKPVPETIEGKCEYRRLEVNCKSRLIDGSKVLFSCKDNYESNSSFVHNTVAVCTNGIWDREFLKCTPQCGKAVELQRAFIVGGEATTYGKFPWHVGVYFKDNITAPSTFICGGSLISMKIVLSAAHCFTEDNGGQLLDKTLFTIAAGKYYRELFDDKETFKPQSSGVQHIEVGKSYKGILTNYRDDIAVVVLIQPFEISSVVQPVCVDWANQFVENHLKEDSVGELVGWGYTNEQGEPSRKLQHLSLPYIKSEKCFEVQSVSFYAFLTADKFCAGYTSGSSACLGDSGGGLVFRNPSTGRYYIRGIVSSGPKKGIGCDSHKYTLFTNVANYLLWIIEIMSKYK